MKPEYMKASAGNERQLPFLLIMLRYGLKEYRDAFFKKILRRMVIKPWMLYREIDIIQEILRNLKPKKCLEWGAGYSTLYYPKFLAKDAKWIAIEHDKDWASTIQNIKEKPNVEIYHVSPNNFPWTDKWGDGDYSDLKDYIEFPARFGKFGFILVDGRARRDCLVKAHEMIEEGVVILHDANRKYYHESFGPYNYQVLFEDYREDAGGVWIGSNTDISQLLDIDKHKRLWDVICKYGKVFKI